MHQHHDQILSVAQMRAAEDALIAAGDTVDTLMRRAGRGAAEWVRRIAANRPVTVLCGPGNNGGDGYVIAEALRECGGRVVVVAGSEPKTDAARNARGLYKGEVLPPDARPEGDVLVDCLFGSGLTRPLSEGHAALLARLAANHRHAIAIDVPSGVEADTGMSLNEDLPRFDLTIALGAWKFAHFLMPASAVMGALRLVGIGVAPVAGAAHVLARPKLAAPPADSHKYRRGLLAVIGGPMPGAALLAARAAQGAGAGYVKLLAENVRDAPADVVVDDALLSEAIADTRIAAALVGPGLGRTAESRERLVTVLAAQIPAVLDADALVLLGSRMLSEHASPLIATPHDGEFARLENAFACDGAGSKPERATALAKASRMVIVAKGPDTVIAAPDGRIACAPRASSWLSTAGTGDVLAGAIASRLACGDEAFNAACAGVWLQGEAARLCPPAFSAGALVAAMPSALAACL
jgi:ADP-dependent NAD(P)H-hydrate dehydratase / NAD(P)H-hydrate epimerase